MRLQRSSSRAQEKNAGGETQKFWSSFTCGACRHALLIASELECRVVYLCSGKLGCMAKWCCLLFMDIMFARDPAQIKCAKSKARVRRRPLLASRSSQADAVALGCWWYRGDARRVCVCVCVSLSVWLCWCGWWALLHLSPSHLVRQPCLFSRDERDWLSSPPLLFSHLFASHVLLEL